jgi:enoyl-[acyl-carrier-protein] reductase (NADH)
MMSSRARVASGAIAFFGGMMKVVARAAVEGGRLSSLEVGANVVHLFSNVVNEEQGNTIVKD